MSDQEGGSEGAQRSWKQTHAGLLESEAPDRSKAQGSTGNNVRSIGPNEPLCYSETSGAIPNQAETSLSLPTHHTRFAILGLALLVVFQVAAPRQGRAGASGPHGRHVAKGADRSEPAASTSAPIPAPRDSASAPDSGDSAAIPDSGGQVHDPQEDVHPPLESVARGLGLENVTVDRSGPQERIAYENRRFRHSADAYGWLARGGESFVGYERRLGMVAASIERQGAGPAARFRVRYPSDAHFTPPRGPVQDPTSHTVDLYLGQLVAYD